MCEPERVFGENREFERSNHLVEYVVEPRGLENEAPEGAVVPGQPEDIGPVGIERHGGGGVARIRERGGSGAAHLRPGARDGRRRVREPVIRDGALHRGRRWQLDRLIRAGVHGRGVVRHAAAVDRSVMKIVPAHVLPLPTDACGCVAITSTD